MPVTVVFAPDSFKGSIAAAAAAEAVAAGWREADPTVNAVLRPMADGGEGTIAALALAIPGARRIPMEVSAPSTAPAGTTVVAEWLLLPGSAEAPYGTAVVELATTAGIELYDGRLDPWRASTRAFGEAIVGALDRGVSRLVLAIGSSASTDGGAGMLRALGARFAGVDPDSALAAADLAAITAVDLSALRALPPGGAIVLSDVTHPLLGPTGAAAVFGPQKGFDPDEMTAVDTALSAYAELVGGDATASGAGAAGGTGFALQAWGARLVPGSAAVADLIALPDAVNGAALVVTGEGSFDGQSAHGKAPAHVADLAARAGVRTALVAGRIMPDADVTAFASTLSLTALAGSSTAALADPARWLREAGAHLARATGSAVARGSGRS